MGLYYNFYSPKTGKEIDSGKYAGMPFFFPEFDELGRKCAVKWGKTYRNIEEWTINPDSDVYKKYYSNDSYGWD